MVSLCEIPIEVFFSCRFHGQRQWHISCLSACFESNKNKYIPIWQKKGSSSILLISQLSMRFKMLPLILSSDYSQLRTRKFSLHFFIFFWSRNLHKNLNRFDFISIKKVFFFFFEILILLHLRWNSFIDSGNRIKNADAKWMKYEAKNKIISRLRFVSIRMLWNYCHYNCFAFIFLINPIFHIYFNFSRAFSIANKIIFVWPHKSNSFYFVWPKIEILFDERRKNKIIT